MTTEQQNYATIATLSDDTDARGKRPKTAFDETALYKPSDPTAVNLAVFENFKGYWKLDTIDDWQDATIMYFYVDEVDKHFKVKAYHGLQSLARELNSGDKKPLSVMNIPTITDGRDSTATVIAADTCNLEILTAKALRFYNFRPVLSSDTLASTFTIQSTDNNVAYAYMWSDWDGTSDDPRVGYIETMMKYVRLTADFPQIQPISGPFPKNYLSARNAFEYARDYHLYMGQPQKVFPQAWPAGTIANYLAMADNIENVGVTRTSTGSLEKRGGKYIGVWRTKIPNKYPFTTFHTNGLHHFNIASKITVSGLLGPYAQINGVRQAAAWRQFAMSDTPREPWIKDGSTQYPVYVIYDSSKILVDYDPTIHGVPTLTAFHGNLTTASGYSDTIAAVLDLMISAFGGVTHTRLRPYRDIVGFFIYDTWADLAAAILATKAEQFTMRTRNISNSSSRMYWNPYVLAGDLIPVSPFELNDPFNLAVDFLSGNFKIDIIRENYLDPTRTYSMFFTVTGPQLASEPITSKLVTLGYSSNGSQIAWTANSWGVYPTDLADQYGKHPWMLYGAATAVPAEKDVAKASFLGGIINPALTPGQTIAYIRIGSEDGMDAPLYQLTVRPLAFASSIPLAAKANTPWVGSFAALIEKLNSHNPTKYIIDSRNNLGGYAQAASAIASLFGADRPVGISIISRANSDNIAESIEVNATNMNTYGGALNGDTGIIDCSGAAMIFPRGVVRNLPVVFLNSSLAGSGGDELPHHWIGDNQVPIVNGSTAPSAGWNLGNGVVVKFVGNLDGRLASGVKLYDRPPVSSTSSSAIPFTMSCDAGLVFWDRYGTMAYSQPWMAPQKLLAGWYDDTVWQDLGVAPIKNPLALGNLKAPPLYKTKSTWRDSWLEESIVL